MQEITAGNRQNIANAADCGGRLGPTMAGLAPDLRNLSIYFSRVDLGDVVVLCSDGVHDNLDPLHMGLSPSDLGLNCETWDAIQDEEEAEEFKCKWRERFFQGILLNKHEPPTAPETPHGNVASPQVEDVSQYFLPLQLGLNNQGSAEALEILQNAKSAAVPHQSPKDICSKMIQHAFSITKKSRDWMESKENQDKELPGDYIAFPGKMDHATCCKSVGVRGSPCLFANCL